MSDSERRSQRASRRHVRAAHGRRYQPHHEGIAIRRCGQCGLIRLALIVSILFPAVASSLGFQESRVVIYYTASLNGNLDGCTCLSRPRAGLVKQAAYLRSLPDRDVAILVDAGDFHDALPDDLSPGLILDTYAELGYDAVGIGDQELANGAATLLELRQTHPLISNNLMLCPTPDVCHIFSTGPALVRKRWGTAGICSLIDPEVFKLHPQKTQTEVKVSPVQEAAEMLRVRLNEEGVAVSILLYHGSVEEAERLATKVPGFDVIIVGHDQHLLDPVRIGTTILVSPGEEGNRVGRLQIIRPRSILSSFSNSFRAASYAVDPDDPPTRARIDSYLQLLRLRLRKP